MRSRLALTAVAVLAAAAVFAVPAFGGPSLATIAKQAARALKLSKAADARSKKALTVANNAARAVTVNGTNGTNGAPGSTGPAGPAGPAGAQKIDFRAAAGTGDTTVLDSGGLVITARCDSGPNLSVRASSTVANSELHVSGVTQPSGGTASVAYAESDHLGPSSTPVSLPSGNFQGSFTYSTPAGAVVSGTVASEQTAFNGSVACWFGGWALHDAS